MSTTPAKQLAMFDRPEPRPVAPQLVNAEAPPPRVPVLDRMVEVLEQMAKRSDEDLQQLKEVHAELEGVPVDQLDAHLDEQERKRKAEIEEIRRPAPGPRARRGKRARDTTAARASAPTSRLTDRQRELVRGFEVFNNVARYQGKDHVPDWADVKAVFVALGAKWKTGKPGGFRFPDTDDGQEKVRLALETGEILDLKAAGFFPTPAMLARHLVELAGIGPGDVVLEPSAGRGAIALAARAVGAEVECVELLPDNVGELKRLGFKVTADDFRHVPIERRFAAVVMNPPFAGRLDVFHIQHAFDFLAPGARLVSVAAAGVEYRDDQLGRDFRAWVSEHGGTIERLPDGSFLESGTGVRTCLVSVRRGGG
jgi:predicted RNA methylase